MHRVQLLTQLFTIGIKNDLPIVLLAHEAITDQATDCSTRCRHRHTPRASDICDTDRVEIARNAINRLEIILIFGRQCNHVLTM